MNLQLFHSQRECCISTTITGGFVAFPLLSPSFHPYLNLEMNLNCDAKLCNLISCRRLNCANKKKKTDWKRESCEEGGKVAPTQHHLGKDNHGPNFLFRYTRVLLNRQFSTDRIPSKSLLYIINPTEYYKIYSNTRLLVAGLTYMNPNPIFASTLFLWISLNV